MRSARRRVTSLPTIASLPARSIRAGTSPGPTTHVSPGPRLSSSLQSLRHRLPATTTSSSHTSAPRRPVRCSTRCVSCSLATCAAHTLSSSATLSLSATRCAGLPSSCAHSPRLASSMPSHAASGVQCLNSGRRVDPISGRHRLARQVDVAPREQTHRESAEQDASSHPSMCTGSHATPAGHLTGSGLPLAVEPTRRKHGEIRPEPVVRGASVATATLLESLNVVVALVVGTLSVEARSELSALRMRRELLYSN